MTTDYDAKFMLEAILQGEKGRFTAAPNPWVGAVVQKNGNIIGKGFHKLAGTPHAEIMAFQDAKDDLKGATLYVTLEPCCHFGRTPPCTQAIIKAGIKRVVIALTDPDPKVSGKGILELKNANIETVVGVEEEKARSSLEPYLFQRKYKRPFTVLKAAITIDGKVAAEDGTSKWITGDETRLDAHLLRAESQAILVGSRTALHDMPTLTVRHPDLPDHKQPLRVVLDRDGLLEREGALFNGHGRTLIVTGKNVSPHVEAKLKECHTEVLKVSENGEELNLDEVLTFLAEQGVIQLLVEGGAQTFSTFIKKEKSLAQRLVIYMAPKILGANGLSLFPDLGITNINDAYLLNLIKSRQIGSDVRLDFVFKT